MNSYVTLGIASAIPIILSVVFYLLDKKTPFGGIKNNIKQIIYGVSFGGLAILGTEWGIPINGAMANCRDGAVLCAGLLFGAPAGLIAGAIGGVERWIAVWWGVGSFTRVACSVSTIIAGVYSAGLRKFMFEDKKPGWLLSFAIGIVMEVFHLTMVFITNMDEPTKAMEVVKACTVPMLTANGLSVTLSAMAISFLSREKIRQKQSRVRISQTIQRWLLVAVLLAFSATSFFVFSLQDTIAEKQTDSLLDLALSEVSLDIKDNVNSGNPDDIYSISKNRHVGETGYVVILDSINTVISAPEDFDVNKVKKDFSKIEIPNEDTTFKMTLLDKSVYCRYEITEGYCVMAVLPEAEALQMRNIALYVNTFMEILVFAVLFGLIYLLIKKVVVNQIKSINGSLSKITEGNLDIVVDVRTNEEFASLSDDINSTVDTLKRYIDEATQRIDKELEFAKNIQSSALPRVFPAFPTRKDFDIYASMNPAKEVGGDFYDFYLTHDNTLNFVVADVSGKGIPAAMFMMRAKTELKSLTETDLGLAEVFTKSNSALCEGNDAGMFVTAWQGSLDLKTGKLCYANAGHNPPLIKHKDGKFEFLRSRAGFVLAGMEGLNYKSQEIQLSPGDKIFLYTDGVTEATDKSQTLFGEERLLESINKKEFDSMRELCETVKGDVDKFVGDAPQFDDITMVALSYDGEKPSPTIEFAECSLSDIPKVTEFIETELEKIDCPMKAVIQINVAIDEIYSNIVRYGYPDKKGEVKVRLVLKENPNAVCVIFEDKGIPYNPLTKEDPDITLSAEDRQIGGLGIFMVKKTMDEIKYKYENDTNIFMIKKNI